jgi:hypothetical protein
MHNSGLSGDGDTMNKARITGKCLVASTVLLLASPAVNGSLFVASAAEASRTEICGPTRVLGVLKPGKLVPLEEGFRDPPPICRVQCW